MDFELTDEQRLVRETARAFTETEIGTDSGWVINGSQMFISMGNPETSIAKLFAAEAAVRCASAAIRVHGGSGYVDDYPVERYLRDARVTTLYGTSQIQKLIIGRALTGVNALVPA